MTNKLKLMAVSGLAAGGSFLGVAVASAQTVDDVVASSTAAIVSGGGTVFGVFFGILPTILLYVVPIVIVLWGIRWIIGHFHGKGKK